MKKVFLFVIILIVLVGCSNNEQGQYSSSGMNVNDWNKMTIVSRCQMRENESHVIYDEIKLKSINEILSRNKTDHSYSWLGYDCDTGYGFSIYDRRDNQIYGFALWICDNRAMFDLGYVRGWFIQGSPKILSQEDTIILRDLLGI